MKAPLWLSLLCACALSSWAGQPPTVVEVSFQTGKGNPARMEIVTKTASFRAVNSENGRSETVVKKVGSGMLDISRDQLVPTDWELPRETRGRDGNVYLTPMTPKAFDRRKVGLTMQATARLESGLVVLGCEVTQSEARQMPSSHGEGVDRIITRDGRVVTFPTPRHESGTVTNTTNFTLVAKPGKTYTVPVLFGGKTVPWRITCAVR